MTQRSTSVASGEWGCVGSRLACLALRHLAVGFHSIPFISRQIPARAPITGSNKLIPTFLLGTKLKQTPLLSSVARTVAPRPTGLASRIRSLFRSNHGSVSWVANPNQATGS